LTNSIAYTRDSPEDFEVAIKHLEAELKSRGFGVLANLRVHDIMKEKIGVIREPLTILEVCSPKYADVALSASRDISLLLPCKIVVRKEGDRTRIDLLKPMTVIEHLMPLPGLRPLGEEVEHLLEEAVDASVRSDPPRDPVKAAATSPSQGR
jgi:uncharacterized protein (DUF302 family)